MDHNKSVYAPIKRAYPIQPEPAKEGYFTRKFSNLKSYFSRGRHHSPHKASPHKASPHKASPHKALSPKKRSEQEEREFKEDERDNFVQLFLDKNDRVERSRRVKIYDDDDANFLLERRKKKEQELKPPPHATDREKDEFYRKIYQANEKELHDDAKRDRDFKKDVEDELASKYEPAREEFNKLFDIYYRQTNVPGVSSTDKIELREQLKERVGELREKHGYTRMN